jgi:hypothetical protein
MLENNSPCVFKENGLGRKLMPAKKLHIHKEAMLTLLICWLWRGE